MPYALFHHAFPEVAAQETRTLTVLDSACFHLPPGQYSFFEMYCDEPGCDCRRVMFSVVSSVQRDVGAVIAYGWESPRFYAKWLGADDPLMIEALRGPVLNLGSPQSALAPALLDMMKKVVMRDQAYLERIKHHYAMFRERIEQSQARSRRRTKERKRRKI